MTSITLPLRLPTRVFCLSLLALPLSAALHELNIHTNVNASHIVALIGVAALVGVAAIAYVWALPPSPSPRADSDIAITSSSSTSRSPSIRLLLALLTVFCFTSAIDAILALTLAGYTSMLDFYCEQGEVYMTTPHGLAINAHDATAHYAMYILLAAAIIRAVHEEEMETTPCTNVKVPTTGVVNSSQLVGLGTSVRLFSSPFFRIVAYLWCGSMVNSLSVLLIGTLIGLHAEAIKPSYALNFPYAIVPITLLVKLIQSRHLIVRRANTRPINGNGNSGSTSKSSRISASSILLAGLLLVSCGICLLRFLVVVRSRLPLSTWWGSSIESHLLDHSGYPTMQMILYAAYLMPYFAWAMTRVMGGATSIDAKEASSITGVTSGNAYESDISLFEWSVFAIGAQLQGTFSYMSAALYLPAPYPDPMWRPQSTQFLPFAYFIIVNALLFIMPFGVIARLRSEGKPNTYGNANSKIVAHPSEGKME